MNNKASTETTCSLSRPMDLSGIKLIELDPQPPPADYRAAIVLANRHAERELGDNMLLSWYDRDRHFESPQHSSECHQEGATPGYVDYGIHHGAKLMIDIQQGRFVFFYLPLDDL